MSQALQSVLVTGGGGFVGYHIVSKILETEPTCRISVLDLPSLLPRFPTVQYFDVDVSSKQDVLTTLQKIQPRVIFHAACTYSLSLPAETHSRINTQGTINVLEAAQTLSCVKAFIYHSSSSVIEDGASPLLNARETAPVLLAPRQKFPYPLSKAVAESYVLSANRQRGILTASLRPAGTFGEADTEMMEKLLGVARSGRAHVQMGDGKNLYDFLYVGNLAHAHLLAAQALLRASSLPGTADDDHRVDGEAFHITNDEPWLFWEFTRAVAREAGYPVRTEEIRVIPTWVGMVMAFVAEWVVWMVSAGKRESNMTRYGVRYSCLTRTLNIDKAKRRLGYRPVFGMQEALERTVKSFGGDKEKEQ
jgi:sterol-4alpha-carboxylate 3-dehydrogenase (decarboxylating)